MPWDGVERRKHKRFGVKNCTFQFRKSSFFSFLSIPSEKYLVLNVSEGGLHFISKEKITENEKLVLHIEAPEIIKPPIRGTAKVIWVKHSQEFNTYRVGVQFSNLSSKARALLKTVLDSTVLDQIDITTKAYLKELKKIE